MRIASPDARFSVLEIRWGLVPGWAKDPSGYGSDDDTRITQVMTARY